MAVLALFRSSRVNRAQYDAIIHELDLEGDPPAGAISHVAGFDRHGACVMDVWESQADFDRFVQTRLQPAFARLNLSIDAPEVMEAYAVRATEAIDRFKPALATA